MFLVNSRYRHFTATPSSSTSESLHPIGVLLIPKLRSHFAEFLNESSLKRLRILTLPTCVGLRYSHHISSLRGFSWQCGINQFIPQSGSSWPLVFITGRADLPALPTYVTNRDIQHPDGLPSYVTPSLKRLYGGTGILTCFPSPTPFGLGLGTD